MWWLNAEMLWPNLWKEASAKLGDVVEKFEDVVAKFRDLWLN